MAETQVQPACLSTSKPLPPNPPSPPSKPRGAFGEGGEGDEGNPNSANDTSSNSKSPSLGLPTLPGEHGTMSLPPALRRPDYILTAAYMLISLELAWLTLWILRSL
ncbi:hypothetical protein BN1723_012219 [Verticillium longisporum]|uniref:Uncharacterized protein n=1 Tax=Verticillium longisporum TaxID=100787 RepID=A0A0G4LGX3_VERLO|nr:hypothetical protein BN1723_012219 [Verticillium longisporum]